MERDLEIRDRFLLLSYGLKLKSAMRTRLYVLETVAELKRRFRKFLYMWQDKRAEENFLRLTKLIMEYDKNESNDPSKDATKKTISLGGKLSKKKTIRVMKTPTLHTVEEREEELEETTVNEIKILNDEENEGSDSIDDEN